MPSWNYKYQINGKFEKDGQTVYLHPENFTNFIGVWRYFDRLFPTYLARLEIDKRLFDYVITNADSLRIHITVASVEMSNKEDKSHGTPEVIIDSDMAVIVSSDLNYNDALDYVKDKFSSKPDESLFRSTYIGLVPSECLDAMKIVENINIIDSYMQDLVLNYCDQKGLHLLIEPFHHNKYFKQLILPPMDTTFSLMEYLNNLSTFYNTRYILFFEEPRITYLLSKNGKGVPCKIDRWDDVIINVHSTSDPNNVQIGMQVDGWTTSYIIDVIGTSSTFTMDNTTNKIFDSIAAILNPSLDNSKLLEDTFKNIKDAFKKSMDSFLTNVKSKSQEAIGMATKLCESMHHMDHSVISNMRVTRDLDTTVKSDTMTAIENIPKEITKRDPITGKTTTIPFMDDVAKSILKTNMNNKFISCQDSKNLQNQVQGCFGDVIGQTNNQYYNSDFLDNNIRAVTYINLQDVTKLMDNSIRSMNTGTAAAIKAMASTVTPFMGSFSSLPNTLGSMKSTIDSIISLLRQTQGPDPDLASSSASESIAELTKISGCFGGMQSETTKFGNIGIGAHVTASASQSLLKGFSDSFQKAIGMFSMSQNINLKGKIISQEAARIFGAKSLNTFMSNGINDSLTKYVGKATTVLSSNLTKITAVTNAINGGLPGLQKSLLSNCVGGIVKVADLKNLSKNIEKFDLSGISKLGLNNISFDLNIGTDPNKKAVGTKLLKVRNDNPNQLKNIKSEMEINKNELIFHKEGLDVSAFTPNKRYHINNFVGYNHTDGDFLLKEKVVIFAREDDLFSADTKLTFVKAVQGSEANNETEKATATNKPDPQSANKK